MQSRLMKAAVCYGPNDIRFEQVPIAEPQSNEVLVRIAYCGICPSDFRVYDGRSSQTGPMILGHEFTGWIEETGSSVTDLKAGDRVVVDPAEPCITACPACRRGITNKCLKLHVGGGGDGLAQYRIAPANRVYPLRPSTDLAAASFGEPLACVLHGHKRASIRLGSTVLIVGSGPIGLMHMLLAKRAGARVIVSEPSPARLAAAAELGVDALVNPREQDLAAVVNRETEGWGVDAAIVAVGNKAAIESAIPLLGMQATIILFAGVHPNVPISVDPGLVHYSEINITGSSDYTDADFNQSLRLIEDGIVDTRRLVSDILPFDQVRQGMETVRAADRLKVVIQVNER